MTKNAVGIDIPKTVEGIGELTPYQGEWTLVNALTGNEKKALAPLKAHAKSHQKYCENLDDCLTKLNLKDGMTVSFHHHLRGGDETIVPVMQALAARGLKNLTIAPSSLTGAHEALLPLLEDGTITRIWTSGLRGALGKAVSKGILDIPVMFHSHGGRARAIQSGQIKIDVAFVAAPAADKQGNATGCFGPSAFGAMGYSKVDMEYAQKVVILSDNFVDFPCVPTSVPQDKVDYVVPFERIGDPQKIAGDTTRVTENPMELQIAELAAKAIDAAGSIKEGFSFQTGAGGSSLAVSRFIREMMLERKIQGSFLLGGITSVMTEMLEEELFTTAFDVQSFDAAVKTSMHDNPRHVELSADQYANPFNAGCMTHQLSVVVLAALEVDKDFNVNVMVGSDGVIRGASGGHCDAAAGADLTVIVVPSIRKGTMPIIKERVTSVVTPGDSVDIVVTEECICINPKRTDLIEKLGKTDLPIRDIADLAQEVSEKCGPQKEPQYGDKIVGLIEYRDGSIIDVIRNVL
ncbi:MAG: citrate lyase subunit alpha [Alphaproteobacteria bacterium]